MIAGGASISHPIKGMCARFAGFASKPSIRSLRRGVVSDVPSACWLNVQ